MSCHSPCKADSAVPTNPALILYFKPQFKQVTLVAIVTGRKLEHIPSKFLVLMRVKVVLKSMWGMSSDISEGS